MQREKRLLEAVSVDSDVVGATTSGRGLQPSQKGGGEFLDEGVWSVFTGIDGSVTLQELRLHSQTKPRRRKRSTVWRHVNEIEQERRRETDLERRRTKRGARRASHRDGS